MLNCKRCSCTHAIFDPILSKTDDGLLEKTLSALSSTTRIRILLLLNSQPHCVCDLSEHTSISQSLISQYLTILENAGLIDKKRDGKFIEYFLTPMGKKAVKAINLLFPTV